MRSASASACVRSVTSTRSSGSGESPATKSPNTASSSPPTGWSRLVDARAADLARLLDREVCLPGDLLERRLAAQLRPQHPLGPIHLLHPLDDVHGHPDRAPLVRKRPGHRLPDPPRGVRGELVAAAPVEL